MRAGPWAWQAGVEKHTCAAHACAMLTHAGEADSRVPQKRLGRERQRNGRLAVSGAPTRGGRGHRQDKERELSECGGTSVASGCGGQAGAREEEMKKL